MNQKENVNVNHLAGPPAPNAKTDFFNQRDLKTRLQQKTQESEIKKTLLRWKPATVEDSETDTIESEPREELHIPQDLPIDIPLRDITFKFNKESWEDPILNLLLTVGWDANGTHPDNALRIYGTIVKDKAAR